MELGSLLFILYSSIISLRIGYPMGYSISFRLVVRVKLKVVRVILINFLDSITRNNRVLSIELSYSVARDIDIIKKFRPR